ncbi:hypothetical protein [Aureliella helgolandensis]|uniref:hypothetical protein n=1 Tax=Aureliella helgolandensis TaxID=2527968 RepID=UPI0011A3118D|nr:hypothetical protein [Aureliella helgolandensis]
MRFAGFDEPQAASLMADALAWESSIALYFHGKRRVEPWSILRLADIAKPKQLRAGNFTTCQKSLRCQDFAFSDRLGAINVARPLQQLLSPQFAL